LINFFDRGSNFHNIKKLTLRQITSNIEMIIISIYQT